MKTAYIVGRMWDGAIHPYKVFLSREKATRYATWVSLTVLECEADLDREVIGPVDKIAPVLGYDING
jgi:hypothetical protein